MREGGHNTKRVQNLLRTSTYLEIFYKFERASDLKSKWQPEHKQQGLPLCEKRCHEMPLTEKPEDEVDDEDEKFEAAEAAPARHLA